MRKTKLTNTIDNISLSGQCTAILVFIFIFGISTGVFFEVMMSTDMKTSMQSYLEMIMRSPLDIDSSSSNTFSALASSILSSLAILLLICASGFTRFSYPISSIVLLLKGISLGYCCALILETLGFKGAFVIGFSLFPQNTLLIPAIILSANAAISKSSFPRSKRNKNPLKGGFTISDTPYIYANLLFCFMAILGCLIQSIFLPLASKIL